MYSAFLKWRTKWELSNYKTIEKTEKDRDDLIYESGAIPFGVLAYLSYKGAYYLWNHLYSTSDFLFSVCLVTICIVFGYVALKRVLTSLVENHKNYYMIHKQKENNKKLTYTLNTMLELDDKTRLPMYEFIDYKKSNENTLVFDTQKKFIDRTYRPIVTSIGDHPYKNERQMRNYINKNMELIHGTHQLLKEHEDEKKKLNQSCHKEDISYFKDRSMIDHVGFGIDYQIYQLNQEIEEIKQHEKNNLNELEIETNEIINNYEMRKRG